MNKLIFIGAGIVTLLAACTAETPAAPSICGTWAVTKTTPAYLEKDTVSFTELLALLVTDDSTRINTITITGRELIATTLAGDNDSLAYTLAGTTGNSYQLQSAQGPGSVVLGPDGHATLSFAGVTFDLKR